MDEGREKLDAIGFECDYVVVDLHRGQYPNSEFCRVGVMRGEVISFEYAFSGQNHNIKQYNGLPAKAFVEQMLEASDPVWELGAVTVH